MAKNSLKKSVLSKVPIEMATNYTVSQAKRHTDANHYIKASVRIIDHRRILVLHVYHREDLICGKKVPKFRVFMTKTEYITQYFENDGFKWRTGRLEALLGYGYYGSKEPVFCDATSEKSVDRYLAFVEDGKWKRNAFNKIREAQNRILGKRLEKKHQVIIKRIDEKMREIKPLPKDFDFWIDEIAMARRRYIFYRYSRRKYMDGYCTHCHQEVKVRGVRHRAVGICPNCGVKVIYLVEGKAKYISDYGQAAYFQKTPKGFVIRYFNISKHYHRDYRNPKIHVTELERDFYEDKKVFSYEYRGFMQTGKVRWCKDCLKYEFSYAAVYTKNLDAILNDTPYRYCALKEFALRWDGAGVSPYGYLYRYEHMPEIEYFTKAGLYRMTYELTAYTCYTHYVQRDKRSLHEMLGLTKQALRFVQACDMSFSQFSMYKEQLKRGLHLGIAEFKRFYDTYYNHTNLIYTILQYTSLHKAERYCQRFVERGHNYLNVLALWKDYINFSGQLGYDLQNDFVLFPKYLFDAHDRAYQELLEKREAERKEQIRREEQKAKGLLQEYRKIYPWDDGAFMVMVPEDLFSIKEEGHALHHCVATYTSRVAEGKSIILFVRQADHPEKPYFTMEICNSKIIQCRGYRNKDMPEEVERFVEKYKKTVLQPIWMKQAV